MLQQVFDSQKSFFYNQRASDYNFRIQQLKKLKKADYQAAQNNIKN